MRNARLSFPRWIAASGLLIFAASAFAQDIYVLDLLNRPERFLNTSVTVVGQVQALQTGSGGGPRGTYTIVDDSTPSPLTIRTEKLPKIGKVYRITGTLLADPARANAPTLKEEKRSPLGSSLTSSVLIAAGAALAVLFVILVILWLKPRRRAESAPSVRPVGPDMSKTIRVPPPPPAESADGGKTQVYRNLGAALILESGPDKGREYPLHLMKTLIGRPGGRLNDIEIADRTVSKEQAALHYDTATKEFTLVNESATNPTLLDGAELSGPTVLKAGAAISVGKVVLRFKVG
ncbi:MAG: FHA domain-containing protein [Candidatus Aminicenantes bacterium]|nr:FHA domain-containing protein [Candidatus Aminicenantes bacterium]